jgi:GT2 family glycosyltransferase
LKKKIEREKSEQQLPEPEETAPVEEVPVEKISVVIVSCNHAEELRKCLAALHAEVEDPSLQVIVVDNGSKDASASLSDEFAGAQFVPLPRNFGLTKALNIGIRASSGDYVLLMHEDVEIGREAIVRLRDELAGHAETGAACPLLINEEGRAVLQARELPSPADPDPSWRKGSPGETVSAVTGAAIMFRRLLLDAMRNIDERYGNYGSDAELCMQVKRANKRVVIVDGATAIHHTDAPPDFPEFAADRQLATRAFLAKYYGFLSALKYQIAALLGALFTFRLTRFRCLLYGQKIDGA